jgi:uncharacterized protein YecE (DUF72 family)
MIRVGTSGWRYPHWRDRFFPRGLPGARWLRFAAERLGALEINTTFYGSLRPATFSAWAEAVRDLAATRGFRFAVKGSRYLTHMKKLRDVEAALANFFATGPLLLGGALGPILWQLPPQLGFDEARLKSFFALLPRDVAAAQRLARRHDARFAGRATSARGPGLAAGDALRYALEPRHASFHDHRFYALCERSGVAPVVADTAGKHVALVLPPPSVPRPAPLAYVRLHGSRRLYRSRYHDRELAVWAREVETLARRAEEVFVFFDNDAAAHAAKDAMRLQNLLDSAGAADRRGCHGG